MNHREHVEAKTHFLGQILSAFRWALALLITLFWGQTSHAATLVHDFYLPMPEAQIRQTFVALNAGTIGSTIDSVYSVVITGDGTVVYYDHWEDGYEGDLTNPTQSTTQIWGDGNDANGIPPGYLHDPASLPKGTVLTLRNNVTLPRNPSTILFDARDRIAATKALVISHAAWATSPGTVLAGAVEVTATIDYGTSYVSPVGQDIGVRRFDYVGFMIMAEQDNTTVTIDTDGSGPTASFNVILNRGESYLVNGGVKKGGTVNSDKRVQVQLVTGKSGAQYATDWFTLYPTEQWSSSYVTPVGTASNGNTTFVYLYNPNASSITVNYTTRVSSGSTNVAANGLGVFTMPKSSGAKFTTAGGEKFFALSSVGALASSDIAYDWGFTLLPQDGLTTEAVVGWGPGSSDGSVNGSPVWVTSPTATRVYIDYNGDGAGSLTDPKGGHYDAFIDLAALESRTVYDPDKDQTAMRLYTLDGGLISAAWGQDPAVAGAGNPYLDFGTTVLPFPVPVIYKSSVIINDVPPTGLSVGDTLRYTIRVDNRGLLPLGNVVALDTPPPSLSYIANSTKLGTNSIPDNVTGTTFPLDESGYTIPLILRAGTSVFTYEAVIVSPGVINNTASTSGYAMTAENTVNAQVPAGATQAVLDFTTSSGTLVTGYLPGDSIYVTLADSDANTNATTIQTMQVIVKNDTSGDLETITLTETGVNTGVFRNSGLPTSLSGGLAQNDGTLHISAGDSLSVVYVDPLYFDSDSASVSVQTPSLTKYLYLSDTLLLDRIDPVASGDVTTVQSALMGSGGGGGITLANTTTNASTGATTLTISHDPGSGSDRLMLVSVVIGATATTGSGNATNVTSVTFASTNTLTLVGGTNDPGNRVRAYLYRMVNPPSGANNVVITLPASRAVSASVHTFTGVDQTTPLGSAFLNAEGDVTGAGGPTVAGLTNITSAVGELVFDLIAVDQDGGSISGLTNAVGQTKIWGSTNLISTGNAVAIGANSTKPGAALVTNRWGWTSGATEQYGMVAVSIKPSSSGTAVTTSTFTQTPVFTNTFSMPAGGALGVAIPVSVASGSMPANPSIYAYLQYGSTTFATLSSPTYGLVSGVNTLTWSGTLSTNVTIPSGTAVSLIVSNAQSGVTYNLEYDSSTRPAKINLPTTTVIKINSLGLYDAPYPGGNLITAAANGATVYVRTAVSDPFGSYDITSLGYSITGPSSYSLSGSLTVATSDDGRTKIFDYPWSSGATPGTYSLTMTANEGSEGITDTAATTIALNFLDLGTSSTSYFTSSSNGPVALTFSANGTLWLKVVDADQNTNSTTLQTYTVVVTSSSGDSESVTLTETGVNTGVFVGSLATSTTTGTGANNGTLNAPLGSVLTLTATDPDDASDVSTATATIPAGATSVSVTHTLVTPTDGTAIVGETVQFQVRVVNNGSSSLATVTLTDTFPAANLTYVTASAAPSSTGSGTLTWNNLGPLAAGASTNLTVTFTAAASASPATVSAAITGSASASANASVTITHPAITVTQTVLTPGTGNIGDNVTFRIVVQNTGDTVINTLPLEDTFSGAYFQYVSSTLAPDGTGSGSLFWSDITGAGTLGVGSSITIDVTLKIKGGLPSPGGVTATSTAAADFGVDANGDPVSVTSTSSSSSITTYAAKFTGRVYNDTNANGAVDSGEGGLRDVTIILYTDPNGDGNPADGVAVTTMLTDTNGYYEAYNLAPGSYVLEEVDPTGYVSVSPLNNRISITVTGLNEYASNYFFDVIDTFPPAAPSIPDMTAASDLGGSNTDNITSNNTPTFTGTAEPGSTVKLYSDYPSPGTLIGTGVADSSGNYSITVSTLANGTHHISATATDFVGNVSTASGSLTVVIDTTPPAALIASISGDTGSSSSDFITKDNTLVFSGTTSAGAAVTLTLTNSSGGTVFSVTVTADATGHWTYDYTGTTLSDGTYGLTASSGTTVNQQLVIDTTAPAGPVLGDPQITDDTTPTITGLVFLNAGDVLTVTVNGVTYTAGDGNLTVTGNSWSLTIPPGNALPPATGNAGFDGLYTVTETVTDTAGNTLVNTSSLTITVYPTLTAATGGGAISVDNFGTGAWVTLTGPIYNEGISGDVSSGTLVLKAPAGFEFDTGGVAPTVKVTGNATNATFNVNGATTGTSLAVSSVTASTITFTVTAESTSTNALTWQNIRVRPTAGTPLSTGNITLDAASTGSLRDVVTGTSNLGTLSSVPGALSGYKLSAASATPGAGASDLITIRRVDQYGNTITNFTGDVSLTFSGLGTSAAGNVPTITDKTGAAINFGTGTTISFVNGVSTLGGTLVAYKAESTTLQVSDGTYSSTTAGGSGAPLTVSSGTASAYRITAASGTPTAGTSDVLTIRRVDQYGNTVTSLNGDVSLTFSGLGTSVAGNVPTITDKNGSAVNQGTATTITFTSGVGTVGGTLVAYKAETATLQVTDGTLSSSGTGGTGAALTVGPSTAAAYRLSAASNTVPAGSTDTLTIRQVDSFGNVVTSLNGDVSLTFSGLGTSGAGNIPTVTDKNGSSINLGTATIITFSSGVSSVGGILIPYKAETATLHVTDGTRASTNTGGVGVTLTITGLSVSRLGFATQPDKAEVGALFLQQPVVQTQDTYGNPSVSGLASSVPILISLTDGPGTNGTFAGTFTANIGTGSGNGTVTFADLMISGTSIAGPGNKLTVTSPGLTSGVSLPFDLWTIYMTTGDIIVADRGPYFSTGTILISRVSDPTTAVIITSIKDPYEVSREADGNFVVVDYETSRGGGLFRINRLTFEVTRVSSGGDFKVPFGVKVETKAPNAGQILVADLDAFGQAGAIFRVDPLTGAQTTLTQGGNFYFLQGLAVAPTNTPNFGDIYVTSVGNGTSITSKLIKVDPTTGAQTIVSSADNFNYPVGIAVEGDGNLIVVDALAKKVIRVDPTTGVQTVLSDATNASQGLPFLLPTHVSLDGTGQLYISDGKVNAGTNERLVFKVDKTTGNRVLVTQDGFFEQPRGLQLIP